jgi:hypothetical protein
MYSSATFVETGLSVGINATELESLGIERVKNKDTYFVLFSRRPK